MNHRSSDLLQTEEPYTLSERHSSSDSNKVSSGEVSPYDNNSPVMSERRAAPDSLEGEQTFRIPGQYGLVGQVTNWNRESGAESWGSKGELFSQKLTVKGWALKWQDNSLISLDTISEEHANIWGTWHTTLKPILKDQQFTGNTH